jgi:nucleoside-diphosphate-sugar epimerase
MRIFITGGTGFIGKPTLRELQKRGHELLILSPEPIPKEFKNLRKLTFVKGNLSNSERWLRKLKSFRPEAALHMAWEGLPDYGQKTSIKNLNYGLNLFYILGKVGCKKVVTTGSCWEYGTKEGKLHEDMPVYPFNSFSAAKNALHWLGKEIAQEYRMQFIWTRLFFVYGPGQRKESLIPYLISCKKSGRKPKIKNPDGGNDFIYVEDVARALSQILEKKIKSSYTVYNIGSGKLISNLSVANYVYGRKLYSPPRRPKGFLADITKIQREIGWCPTVYIYQGINITLVHYERPPSY